MSAIQIFLVESFEITFEITFEQWLKTRERLGIVPPEPLETYTINGVTVERYSPIYFEEGPDNHERCVGQRPGKDVQ